MKLHYRVLVYLVLLVLLENPGATLAQPDVGKTHASHLSVLTNYGSGKHVLPMSANGKRSPVSGTKYYYIYPYTLNLVKGERSSVPIRVVDQDGNPLMAPVNYFNYDTTLVSVSSDGYVTAKRTETSRECGTSILANIGGQQTNACDVRVLSKDYGISFNEVKERNTILWYPAEINGEDIAYYVNEYQIPLVLDYSYDIQKAFIETIPVAGCKQVYAVILGDTLSNAPCGGSGNPIGLGWTLEENEWSNCFLVPFIPPRSPQWGVMLHELGHNLTWPSYTFAQGLGIGDYSEGIATAISLATQMQILQNPSEYPTMEPTWSSIFWVLNRDTTNYVSELNTWVASGAPFSSYNADLVDGIWLSYRHVRPSDFAMRFFLPLQPQYESRVEPLFSAINSAGDNGRHTFFAALVSASVGRDLSSQFTSTYHFPLVQSLFNDCYSTFSGIIDSVLSAQTISPPVLATPRNDSTGVAINPTLTWNISAGVTSYHLQISTDSTFVTITYDTTGVIQNARSVSDLSYQTKYYWRVNATNGVRTSAWSGIWSFTTQPSGKPPESICTFQLPGNMDWFDTGISLHAGDTALIAVSGLVYIGALDGDSLDYQAPEGSPGVTPTYLRAMIPFPDSNLALWSCIGRIGTSGAPFPVGAFARIAADSGGELYLRMNDNNVSDNSGNWFVTVSVNAGISSGIAIRSVVFLGDVGQNLQTTIKGIGFGGAPVEMPYTGFLHCGFVDNTNGFEAGNLGDSISLNYYSWCDSEIVFHGFGNSYGMNGWGNWQVHPKDSVMVIVINDSTGQVAMWSGLLESVTSVRQISPLIPSTFGLSQNYPNPFNPTTTISFSLKQNSNVRLVIFNVLGQRVQEFDLGRMSAGTYSQIVDMSRSSSGVYLYRIEAVAVDGERFISMKKMVLIK